jgi:hypothetical protein
MNPTAQKERIFRINNPNFRRAYCLKPGFRYDGLTKFCKEIVIATDGESTDIDEIASQITECFTTFDPDLDCIVPTGTSILSLLAGAFINYWWMDSAIAVAFFQKKVERSGLIIVPESYVFYRFYPKEILKLY